MPYTWNQTLAVLIIFLCVLNNLVQKLFLLYMIHSYLQLGKDYLLFPLEDYHFHINATAFLRLSIVLEQL